jgi:anti-sigma-K factor RskA
MALEITPVTSKPARQLEIGEKPGDTPGSVIGSGWRKRGLAVAAVAATQVLNPAYLVIDDPITPRDMTGYHDEGNIPVDAEFIRPLQPEEEVRLSTAESANQSRLELLAREYVAGQLSTEEEARLAIVSERVRRLIPRVTVREFEELERIAADLKQIGSENSERRRRIESL